MCQLLRFRFPALLLIAAVLVALTPGDAWAIFGLFRNCRLFNRPTTVTANCNPCCPPPTTVTQYVPQVSYRRQVACVPVTTFRVQRACDPCTGCPTTSLRPVTTMVRRVQMVPYTTYRPVTSVLPSTTNVNAALITSGTAANCGAGCTTSRLSTSTPGAIYQGHIPETTVPATPSQSPATVVPADPATTAPELSSRDYRQSLPSQLPEITAQDQFRGSMGPNSSALPASRFQGSDRRDSATSHRLKQRTPPTNDLPQRTTNQIEPNRNEPNWNEPNWNEPSWNGPNWNGSDDDQSSGDSQSAQQPRPVERSWDEPAQTPKDRTTQLPRYRFRRRETDRQPQIPFVSEPTPSTQPAVAPQHRPPNTREASQPRGWSTWASASPNLTPQVPGPSRQNQVNLTGQIASDTKRVSTQDPPRSKSPWSWGDASPVASGLSSTPPQTSQTIRSVSASSIQAAGRLSPTAAKVATVKNPPKTTSRTSESRLDDSGWYQGSP